MPNTFFKYILEIACFNVESCILAQQAGADRIEFCANYNVGGTTPLHKDILEARKLLQIPLRVIIRPRGGNFVYTADEVEIMKNDILFCSKNKIDGVVFGALNVDNTINVQINKELIELAKPISTTFHRAIDECSDIENSLEQIIELGFNNVLTSGGKLNALQGASEIKKWQQKFGEKITIIAGGGIRANNVKFIIDETDCKQFHSAALSNNENVPSALEIKQLKGYLF